VTRNAGKVKKNIKMHFKNTKVAGMTESFPAKRERWGYVVLIRENHYPGQWCQETK
jgi:hypothetical protein